MSTMASTKTLCSLLLAVGSTGVVVTVGLTVHKMAVLTHPLTSVDIGELGFDKYLYCIS